ncbi:hypothetical protein [Geopseudomonas aromaticivorans]
MHAEKKVQIILFLGTLLSLYWGASLLTSLAGQGSSSGIEGGGSYYLDALVFKASVLSLAMLAFGLLSRYSRVEASPIKSLLIIVALAIPVSMLVQSAVPSLIARGMASASPERAAQAVDAYYANLVLAEGGAVLPGLPGFDGKEVQDRELARQRTFFGANIFFLMPDVARRMQPAYSREELPLAYLYHRSHSDAGHARKVDFARLPAAQKAQLQQDYDTLIKPVDDIDRVRRMIFAPYSMMVGGILLLINAMIFASNLVNLALFGRKLRWAGPLAAFIAAGFVPVYAKGPISHSETYQALLAREDITLLGQHASLVVLQLEVAMSRYIGMAFHYVEPWLNWLR